MWKSILILVLFTYNGLGQLTDIERQWEDGDARQNCTRICTQSCQNCTDPITCSDQEHKCPQDESQITNDCPPDDVCVPIGCQCKSKGSDGQECTLICPVNCDEDEILCPGDVLPNGCKENDYCHPKGTGNNGVVCPGFCPKDCDDSELKCPVPNDPITDCAKEPECVSKQLTDYGYECAYQQCPLHCEESEILCSGEEDGYGCKTEDKCVPRDTNDSGDLCTGVCPIECHEDEVTCPGGVDSEGCPELDVCRKKARDKNGNYCPDASASHECPTTCKDDEIQCPPELDSLGCLEEAQCTPRTKGNDGNYCPEESDCPRCPPGQDACPTGIDPNGCKKPILCVEQERNLNGELCPVHCLNVDNCNDNEIFCPGARNEIGCLEPGECVVRDIKTKGSDIGGLCPGWCPPICEKDEILCPSQEDPCDGCPTETVCKPAAKDANDMFCSGMDYPYSFLSASHNCPHLCDELDGFSLCPVMEQPNGCKPEAYCIPNGVDVHNNWCPRGSACPKYCSANELMCDYGELDSRGCKMEPVCVEKGTNKDGEECPTFCPPICKDGKVRQLGGVASNGCVLDSTCQDVATHIHNASSNMIHCHEWSYLNCMDTPTAECDLQGFYEPRQWKPTLQEATNWCLINADCLGIVRSDDGYEPRKGPNAANNPNAYEAWWCINTIYNPYYNY